MSRQYKINEVAKILGISPSAIRFYEKKGLFSASKNEDNGYRTFDENDIYKIWSITYHRNIDMSLSDIYRLKHSDSLEDIYDMVQHQKGDTLLRIEEEKRKLAVWQYYERLAERSLRFDAAPKVTESGDLHVFSRETFYNSNHSTFPISNPVYIFSSPEKLITDSQWEYCVIFDLDMHLVSADDYCFEEHVIPSFPALSVVSQVEGDFNEGKALALALEKAATVGYDVVPPYYVVYLMSSGDWEHAVRYYEVFLPLVPTKAGNIGGNH